MNLANGAATNTITSSVRACTMPATGDVAPDRMFVAVRAIAPVAGIPPNIGTTTLATPCASSSTSGLCRSPPMLSATTADNKLSIAASIATVQAEGSSGRIKSTRNSGIEIAGSPVGMPPNLLPIVSTPIDNAAHATVVANKATIEPGTRFVTSGHNNTIPSVITAVEVAVTLTVSATRNKAIIRGTNSLGPFSMVSQKKSLI